MSLESYLSRNGFTGEAALAHAAPGDPGTRAKLAEALRTLEPRLPLSPEIAEMEEFLTALFGETSDLILRRLEVGCAGTPVLLASIRGAVDRGDLQIVLATLLDDPERLPAQGGPDALIERIAARRANLPKTQTERDVSKLVRAMLDGGALLLVQGATQAMILSAPGWKHRAVSEPESERVVRGPREGFTEDLLINTSLLRHRLRDERLRIEQITVGSLTGTLVALCYVNGICRPSLVAEARQRLERIKTDAIIDSGYIEEFIEDTPWTVFPLVKSSERPDVAAASLSEGRVAILVDGSPFALIVPTSFNDMLQAPEDYYDRFPIVLMLRVLRWAFAGLALLGPALYVAFTTYHQEMIPTPLLLSIISAREGVPFPAVVEALIMEITFEALREAGIRMPKTIGQAITIVGALVIGQAAVQAGFVSAPMVIVVSLTGLASFVIPKFSAAISLRMLRFGMLFLAGAFGAYGLTLGLLVVAIHLTSLRSFGAAYFSPLAPVIAADLDDLLIRSPHWAPDDRPTGSSPLDVRRTAPGQKPGPDRPGAGGEKEGKS